MVKVRNFQGFTFSPESYEQFLATNIENLQPCTFNCHQLIKDGSLKQDKDSCLYLYQQRFKSHISTGVMGQISLKDYNQNHIKIHQKTLHNNLNQKMIKNQHLGPVVVCYKNNHAIEILYNNCKKKIQIYAKWNTIDGRSHTLWKITQFSQQLINLYSNVENLYVMDGHHRLQAAHNIFLQHLEAQWIQAIIYSSCQIMVHPQHRVLKNFPDNFDLISEIKKKKNLFCQQILQKKIDTNLYDIIYKNKNKKLIGINFIKDKNNNNNNNTYLQEKDIAYQLHQNILSPLLHHINFEIDFVPGIIHFEKLLEFENIIFLKNIKVQVLLQKADNANIMQAKSTWFEPKPCSHMVVRFPQTYFGN